MIDESEYEHNLKSMTKGIGRRRHDRIRAYEKLHDL